MSKEQKGDMCPNGLLDMEESASYMLWRLEQKILDPNLDKNGLAKVHRELLTRYCALCPYTTC